MSLLVKKILFGNSACTRSASRVKSSIGSVPKDRYDLAAQPLLLQKLTKYPSEALASTFIASSCSRPPKLCESTARALRNRKFLKWFGNMRCTHNSACSPPPREDPTRNAAVGWAGSGLGGVATLPNGIPEKSASTFLSCTLVQS